MRACGEHGQDAVERPNGQEWEGDRDDLQELNIRRKSTDRKVDNASKSSPACDIS
jgi:hypothetical protein